MTPEQLQQLAYEQCLAAKMNQEEQRTCQELLDKLYSPKQPTPTTDEAPEGMPF